MRSSLLLFSIQETLKEYLENTAYIKLKNIRTVSHTVQNHQYPGIMEL